MSNYDKCIDMLCLTGKMPMKLLGEICLEAHRQIEESVDVDFSKLCNINRRVEYKNQWFEFEDIQFAECGGLGE